MTVAVTAPETTAAAATAITTSAEDKEVAVLADEVRELSRQTSAVLLEIAQINEASLNLA